VSVAPDDHPSSLSERKGWMGGSSMPIPGTLGLSAQKRLEFEDSPFEKHLPEVISQKKKGFSFLHEREGGRDRHSKRPHGLQSR